MLSINWHSLDHICRDRHDLWFFQLALSVWKAILKITRSPKSKFFRVILEPNDELSLENFLPTIPFTILNRSHFNKKNNKKQDQRCMYHHGYHRLPPDGAVIGTFWILLRIHVLNQNFWLNHSCVLRQFLGKINQCWRFPMFSTQSTTVSCKGIFWKQNS